MPFTDTLAALNRNRPQLRDLAAHEPEFYGPAGEGDQDAIRDFFSARAAEHTAAYDAAADQIAQRDAARNRTAALERARTAASVQMDPLVRQANEMTMGDKLRELQAKAQSSVLPARIKAQADVETSNIDAGARNQAQRYRDDSNLLSSLLEMRYPQRAEDRLRPKTPASSKPGRFPYGFLGFGEGAEETPEMANDQPMIDELEGRIGALQSRLQPQQTFGLDEVQQYADENGMSVDEVIEALRGKGYAVNH